MFILVNITVNFIILADDATIAVYFIKNKFITTNLRTAAATTAVCFIKVKFITTNLSFNNFISFNIIKIIIILSGVIIIITIITMVDIPNFNCYYN
jgi:hypothetical protein